MIGMVWTCSYLIRGLIVSPTADFFELSARLAAISKEEEIFQTGHEQTSRKELVLLVYRPTYT